LVCAYALFALWMLAAGLAFGALGGVLEHLPSYTDEQKLACVGLLFLAGFGIRASTLLICRIMRDGGSASEGEESSENSEPPKKDGKS
jgi:hypothetical protein